MDQCEDCSEVVCNTCSTLMSCKFCGCGLCEDCATACGRCVPAFVFSSIDIPTVITYFISSASDAGSFYAQGTQNLRLNVTRARCLIV